jgi:hypothetical protein
MEIQDIEMKIKDNTEGIFAISLVDTPAIEEDFVALSTEEIELTIVDEERRIVVGFLLVPDKKIPRRQKVGDEVKEFNIWFSKETVAKAGHLLMENMNLDKFTVDHKSKVNDISVIELWTVEDHKNDKSNFYNLKPKGGELVAMSKINNDQVWEDVKNKKYKGYSIEARFDGFEQLHSKEETIIEQLQKIINDGKD